MAVGETEQDLPVDSLPTNSAESQVESVPTQPVDTGEQMKLGDAVDTSPPEVDGTSKDTRLRDEQGRFSPKGPESIPDPVQDAINRLRKPDQATPTKIPDKPAKATPDAKVAKPEPVKDATKTSTPVDDLDVPENEKAAWKSHTRERFDKVLTTLRTERETRKADEPLIATGKEFSTLLDEFSLHDDMGFVPREHIAGLISVQASVNRGLLAIQQGRIPAKADREAFSTFGQTVDHIRSQFGIAPPANPGTSATFTGELPQDLKDLVEVYGIDEKRVRMLAALEQSVKAPAQPQQQAAPVQASLPVQSAKPAQEEGVDWSRIYVNKILTDISRVGDRNPQQTLNVLLAHPLTRNEVVKQFPGVTAADVPAVFNALDPKGKYEVLAAAHREMTKQVQPPRPTPPPPATTQRTLPPAATPRRQASEPNGDPVDSAIAFLSSGR